MSSSLPVGKRGAWLLGALIAVNAVLLAAGAPLGSDTPSGADKVRIGLVFDVGGLGDKSFNDAANRGLERAARELGVSTSQLSPGDGSDRESALRQFANDGYDLVIGVGFIFSEDIRRLAREFPEVAFACVDYSPDFSAEAAADPPNLSGLRFREHEGSFLVGAIAGLTTQSKKLGFVGGMKIPLIRKFEAGYEAGVKHVCPECEVYGAYAGSTPKAFADPGTGKELALAQYARGVDVIYHASGKTGAGVFGAATELGKKAIGVDSDQFHEAECCVLTSMVKQVDVAVFEAIAQVAAGRFRGGVRELGLAEGGVGFVYDDNNRAMLPPEVVARVRELAEDISAGRIEVPAK